MYLYLLVAIPFIISSIILYLKYKKVNTKYNLMIAELKKPLREGYYEGDIPLEIIDDDAVVSNNKYHFIVYIRELDRYTNGESKVELDRIEIINGYSSEHYGHIKNVAKKRFCSVVPSNKIEWLESEESLKEQRKLKLEIIKNL